VKKTARNEMGTPNNAQKWFIGLLALALLAITTLLLIDNIDKPVGRAIIGMAGGLIIFWILLGGSLMYRFREEVRGLILGVPGGWKTKFVLFATLLALIEEAVTVTMTNLAPAFGVKTGEAYITASTNYFDVVMFHSVIVFVPLFAATAYLLKRYQFSPFAIFIFFGIIGTVAEALYAGNPGMLAMFPQWVFVYGLMVYLPAYSIPSERGARPVRWWHYIIAIPYVFILALPFVALIALVITGVLDHPNIHFGSIPL